MKSRLCLLVICAILPLSAQEAAKEEGITRQQAGAILDELRAIRQLLSRQQAPPLQGPEPVIKGSLKIETKDYLGKKDAPITVVEFADYECPFCRQFHTTTFEQVRKQYIDTGKIRFVAVDLPLPFHPHAQKAAEAAHCAGDQGQFWQMREILSATPKLALDDLMNYAGSLKLNVKDFKTCLDSDKYKKLVLEGLNDASRLNVNGTPSFLIGKTTPEGVDGTLLVGAQPFPAFEAAVTAAQK